MQLCLDPLGTHRTKPLKEHLETRKFRKQIKTDQGTSAVCRADRTNVGFRAFGAQTGMLRYVVLNACDKFPKMQ